MLVHAVVRLFNQYINAPKSGLIDHIHHTHIYLEMAVLQMNIECGCDMYMSCKDCNDLIDIISKGDNSEEQSLCYGLTREILVLMEDLQLDIVIEIKL